MRIKKSHIKFTLIFAKNKFLKTKNQNSSKSITFAKKFILDQKKNINMSTNDKENLIDTFKSYPFKFMELSLDVIETDPNQPRKLFELRNGGDHTRLLTSS